MTEFRETSIGKIMFGTNIFVDQIGTAFYTLLIIVTIKQKRLHGTCHLLLGIYAVCSLLSKIQILLPFTLFMLPGYGKIPRLYCALIQIIPVGGCMNTCSLMLIIGIDRMLAIFLPIWYYSRNKKRYLKIMFIVSLSFPLLFLGFVIYTAIQDPFLNVQCNFSDLVGSDGEDILLSIQLVLICLTLLCYILMFFKLFYDQWKGKICNIRKSLYKTLAIIMSIQIFGYFFSLSGYKIVKLMSLSNVPTNIFLVSINCLSSLSSTVEVPVLFAVSSAHNLALKDEFNWLYNQFFKDTTTTSVVYINKEDAKEA
uniref:G-protein coupled receptors family 1 profile domain-containing protein n=1 Tax=Meloidogyne enterolobii TaxID=390850 RepID=A0A6V7UBS6_MELEN|nr:unnamed protein product [Meloidogyne enterolobii]